MIFKKNNRTMQQEEAVASNGTYQLSTNDRVPRGIEVEENRIYFYTDVSDAEALELNRLIRRLDVEMKYLSSRLDCAKIPIHLHINSNGGSIFSGLSIVDTIRSCSVPIHTYVEGSVASAATLLSISGQKGKRYMYKNSFMLVHQPYLEWSGKREEFIDEIENQEKIFDTLKKLYMENCNFESDEKLQDLLNRELWLDSDTCLEYGLIDKII